MKLLPVLPRRGPFLGSLALWSLLACVGAGRQEVSGEQANERPNVILFMSDDQGMGDFGFTGNPVLDTPRLDELAAECPRVERFYVSPVCSPTRACLMTGRYNHRTRAIDTWIGRSMMEPEERTLAELLGAAGYRTGLFGKWHLGDCYPLRPQDQGFHEVLMHRGGGLAQPSEPLENESRYTDPILFRNGEEVRTSGFCTDVYVDAALDFIDESVEQGRPFFAYVATNAPHGPFHDVPPALLEKYQGVDLSLVAAGADERLLDRVARTFAMVENIDSNVGRLLDHLAECGIERETIFVFLDDNGPEGGRYTAGLRGHKGQVYEGGIRSPLLVRWPGRLDPDVEVDRPGAHIDLVPTLLEAIGLEVEPGLELDGRSLWPLLTASGGEWPERELVLQAHRGDHPVAEHNVAVVGERWKLVRPSGFGREAPPAESPFELYDLEQDPAEEHDLAASQPGRVEELRAVYARWLEDVSGTREDNYAPPRIHVGSAAEPVTWLTRQDWRRREGGSWGKNGVWLLHVTAPGTYRAELVLRGEPVIDGVEVRTGTGSPQLLVPRPGRAIEVELVLDEGPLELGFVLSGEQGPVGPYQVALSRVGATQSSSR